MSHIQKIPRSVLTGAAFSYFLDDFPNAIAAFSLRLLKSDYTGNCIEVRRASDDTTQNIGFVGNIIDTASLLSFCSGTDGFVKTRYDHSGNGNNEVQTTNADQPQIVSSGSLITVNGKAALYHSTSNRHMEFPCTLNSTGAIIGVCQTSSVSGAIINPSNPSAVGAYIVWQNGSASNPYGGIGTPTTYINNVAISPVSWDGLHDAIATGTQKIVFVDDADFSGSVYWASSNKTSFYYRNAPWQPVLYDQEYVVYNSSQSSNRAGMQDNVNNYYEAY